jgi:hypothetical protein
MSKTFFHCAIVVLLSCSAVAAGGKWAVHEWGTFTSLQDETGQAIGGINTDDEPVPDFVHRLASDALLRPTDIPAFLFQGAPSCHPDVTMRLETPVLYFHPPPSGPNVATTTVSVKFRGGWLTEFYPAAVAVSPGLKQGTVEFPHLRAETESGLAWNDLKLGGNWPLTNTSAHVWTSPRAVDCASVQSTFGESEKFLFYRGVAHIDAPLKISRDAQRSELIVRSQIGNIPSDQPLVIPFIWLVDIQSPKSAAFRTLSPLTLDRDGDRILARTPASFEKKDFKSANLERLKTELRRALVHEGLFADEAEALLNTWQLSYFQSPGMRVFFIVPRAWTDFYLPIDVSPPADLCRVMVGRIEVVTPEMRRRLSEISALSVAQVSEDARRFMTDVNSNNNREAINREWSALAAGRKSLAEFTSIPKSYQTYLDMGRFRNALVLEEAKKNPTPGLTNFISTYRLEAYKPIEISDNAVR